MNNLRIARDYYNPGQSKTFTCVDCGKTRGKSIYSTCDNCGAPVCVNCRGMRMLPHTCNRCKQNLAMFQQQQQTQTPVAAKQNYKKVSLAERISEIENYYIGGNDDKANTLAAELFCEIMAN